LLVGVSLISYGMVDSQKPLGEFELEVLEGDSLMYVDRHISALSRYVTKSPPARFSDQVGAELFATLYEGTAEAFLGAVTSLAARVKGRMDGRMPEGLLVALRCQSDEGDVRAAVLKLDSTKMPAGYLKRVRGKVRLAAIRDALDQPGQLQKGSLYPDPRNDSDVIIGDKIDAGTLYFVGALGLTQEQDPKLAVGVLLTEICARVPERQAAVAASIRVHQPNSVAVALDALEADVPEVRAHRTAIADAMAVRPRPVVTLSPERAGLLRREISGNGITIAGPIADMDDRVVVKELPDGLYEATVTFDSRPADVTRS
jgi:hypothetical protein